MEICSAELLNHIPNFKDTRIRHRLNESQLRKQCCSLQNTSRKLRKVSAFGKSFESTSVSTAQTARKNHLSHGRKHNVRIRSSDLSSNTSVEEENDDQWGFVKTKLAVFVSGGGSNFRAIHKSIQEGKIYGEIAVVVSDKPECSGCQYARDNNIPVLAFPKGKFAADGLSPEELISSLKAYNIEFIVLAGYLKLLPSDLVTSYPRSILNIHPSLLPAFGGKGYFGLKVHEGVIKSGARYSGATVHFVDEIYDNGPIIAQKVVPVYPFDTAHDLQQRVLAEEHKLYSHVIAAICEDRITWREDGIPLIRKSWNDCEYE